MRTSYTSSTSWRAFLVRFAIALALSFTLLASGVGYAFWFAQQEWNKTPTRHFSKGVLAKDISGQPGNFLIVGSDSRQFVDDTQSASRFGTKQTVTGQRSDSIMIAHVDPNAKTSLLVSFPRDLWVTIPGRGQAKINSAFNDGAQKLIETIQTNFDISINHYLEVDFKGFADIVDAIGSVHLYFPTAARDLKTGLFVPFPGCYAANGDQALAYVRSRYYQYKETKSGRWLDDPTSDFGRIRRQQYFIRSLAKEAIHKGARNPVKAKALLDKTIPNLTRDPGLSLQDVLGLVNSFHSTDPAALDMETVPTVRQFHQGQDAQDLRQPSADQLFARLRAFPASSSTTTTVAAADPHTTTVQVLNGTGRSGLAAQTLASLTAAGFVGGGTGDAPRRVAVTEVRYGSGAQAKAQAVLNRLGGAGKLVPLAGPAAPGGADVVLVVGTDFSGVSVGVASTTTSTTATTLPPVPGSTPGLSSARPSENGRPWVGC